MCALILIAKMSVLNTDNVYKFIKHCEIKRPKIAMAQSIQECGFNYSSHNAQHRNNIFGYKGNTKTTTNPKGFAIYNHWFDSVRAYKHWQRDYTGGNYFDYLTRKNYSEDKNYTNKLKQILCKLS